MGPENKLVHFRKVGWFLLKKSLSSFQHMYAGKGYNSNPNSTKRSKLDRVAPVGNRPPTHKNGGPKQWLEATLKTFPILEFILLQS